ncbi:MAG: hypothetical protein WAS51_15580 [Ilumatobacteraceae bacterium]
MTINVDETLADFSPLALGQAIHSIQDDVPLVIHADSTAFDLLVRSANDRIQLILFIGYSEGGTMPGWFSTGVDGEGVYLVAPTGLQSASGTTTSLTGMPDAEAREMIRALGDSYFAKLLADRTAMDQRSNLQQQTLGEVLDRPELEVSSWPIQPQLGASAIIAARAADALVYQCPTGAATSGRTIGEMCGGSTDLVAYGGTMAAGIVAVSADAGSTFENRIDCALTECSLVVVDPSSLAATQIPLGREQFHGSDGGLDWPIVAPSGTVPMVSPLEVKAESLGSTPSGSRIFVVSLLDGSTASAYAVVCTGPLNDVSGCDMQSAQLMAVIDRGILSTIVEVPVTCIDSCRIVIADANDFTRRGLVTLT